MRGVVEICSSERGLGRIWSALAAAAVVLAVSAPVAGAAATRAYIVPWGQLGEQRGYATATPLPNGKVLVAGGYFFSSPQEHQGQASDTAEIYNPTTGSSSPPFGTDATMTWRRYWDAAAPLADGRVLIVGGRFGGESVAALSTAELYDPGTGEFTATGSMSVKRVQPFAAPLPDGRILVGSGFGNGFPVTQPESTEIYDPLTGKFSPGPPLGEGFAGEFAAPLLDGKILVVDGGDPPKSEIFNPATGTFRPGPNMHSPGSVAGASLSSGRVLVLAGSEIEEFDPVSEAFIPTGMTPETVEPLHGAAIATLPGGRAMLAGRETGSYGEVRKEVSIYYSASLATGSGIDFGSVAVATTSAPKQMLLTNQGAQTLVIKAASIKGVDAADFEVVENGCSGFTLEFGESCQVLIAVTASHPGSLAAAVQLSSNSPSSPQTFPLAAEAPGIGISRSGPLELVATSTTRPTLSRPCRRRVRVKKGRAGRHPVVRCAKPARKKKRGSKRH